ncbi:DinB family protein [Planctomycetota bacterium]
MNTKDIVKSQYLAALEMLEQAVIQCPQTSWDDQEFKNKFWHIAYHTLFYTHLYLQEKEEEFVPWEKHREDYPHLGPLPWPPHNEPQIGEPYLKDEILEYLEFCKKEVAKRITLLELDAESGFHWLPFNKLELQFYNIRHVQHHGAQLIDRLRNRENISSDWVGMKS